MYAGSQTRSAFMSQMYVSRLPGKSWRRRSKTHISFRLADDDAPPHYKEHVVLHSELLSFYKRADWQADWLTHHWLDKPKQLLFCFLYNKSLKPDGTAGGY